MDKLYRVFAILTFLHLVCALIFLKVINTPIWAIMIPVIAFIIGSVVKSFIRRKK